jgi:hypothetical protein
MMSGGVNHARSAGERGDLGLERDQVLTHPAIQAREALAEARSTSRGADVGEPIEHRARKCELGHGDPWM